MSLKSVIKENELPIYDSSNGKTITKINIEDTMDTVRVKLLANTNNIKFYHPFINIYSFINDKSVDITRKEELKKINSLYVDSIFNDIKEEIIPNIYKFPKNQIINKNSPFIKEYFKKLKQKYRNNELNLNWVYFAINYNLYINNSKEFQLTDESKVILNGIKNDIELAKKIIVYKKSEKKEQTTKTSLSSKTSIKLDKIYDPRIKRFVDKNTKAGKEVIHIRKYCTICPPDKIYNIKTSKCIKKDGKLARLLLNKEIELCELFTIDQNVKYEIDEAIIKNVMGIKIPNSFMEKIPKKFFKQVRRPTELKNFNLEKFFNEVEISDAFKDIKFAEMINIKPRNEIQIELLNKLPYYIWNLTGFFAKDNTLPNIIYNKANIFFNRVKLPSLSSIIPGYAFLYSKYPKIGEYISKLSPREFLKKMSELVKYSSKWVQDISFNENLVAKMGIPISLVFTGMVPKVVLESEPIRQSISTEIGILRAKYIVGIKQNIITPIIIDRYNNKDIDEDLLSVDILNKILTQKVLERIANYNFNLGQKYGIYVFDGSTFVKNLRHIENIPNDSNIIGIYEESQSKNKIDMLFNTYSIKGYLVYHKPYDSNVYTIDISKYKTESNIYDRRGEQKNIDRENSIYKPDKTVLASMNTDMQKILGVYEEPKDPILQALETIKIRNNLDNKDKQKDVFSQLNDEFDLT
jgi:hypothetical protein